jgi:hypothetical protein
MNGHTTLSSLLKSDVVRLNTCRSGRKPEELNLFDPETLVSW